MTHSSRGFVILYFVFGVLAAAACFKVSYDLGFSRDSMIFGFAFFLGGAMICASLAGLIYALIPRGLSLRELEQLQLEQEKYDLLGEAISVADRTVDGRMRASLLDAIHKRIAKIDEELKKYDD